MHTRKTLTTLALAALLAGSAGAALAQGSPGHGPGSNPGQTDGDAQDNATARREAAQARVAEIRAAREAALASFHENRTAAIEEFRAALNATRESFLENKTRVIEECRAEGGFDAANATDEARQAHAQCVRDGVKPLVEQARAEHAAAREAFTDRLREARQAAMGSFASARAEAYARHGPPQDG